MEKGMKKADFDMRSEFFKVGVSMIVAAALLVGAGVALGTYFYKPTVNYITIQQPAK